jgi:hypothetical protein
VRVKVRSGWWKCFFDPIEIIILKPMAY